MEQENIRWNVVPFTDRPKHQYPNDALIFTNLVCIRSIDYEESKSGIITLDLEHCPPDTLNYINVKYSKLEKLVEKNNLLRRIDSKIRNWIK